MYLSVLTLALSFTGCSDDDDDKNCQECNGIEVCDNGDGTAKVSLAGQVVNESVPYDGSDGSFEELCSTFSVD